MLKLQESNRWVVMTIAICVSTIISAHILSNTRRYRAIPGEARSVTILDTKTGDVYIESTTTKRGKRVWFRKRLSKGVYKNN